MRRSRVVMSMIIGALFATALFGGTTTAPSVHALFSDTDGDSVADLVELSVGSDPNDPQSSPEDIFPDSILGTQLCFDGVDNDGDGATDSGDTGCADDDEDFLSNAMEAALGSDPQDANSFVEDAGFDAVLESLGFGFFQTCANTEDDDGDGAIDAADTGCDPILSDSDGYDDRVEKLFRSDPLDSGSVPEHEMANPGSCSDGIDNDGDGSTDSAEVACRPAPNDSFDSPTVISSIPYQDAVKITSATSQPGEPNSSCFFDPGATIWYRYTASSSGPLAVDTAGSNVSNDVAVWTRNGASFRPVTCASGFAPGPFQPVGARASFQAIAGETYYFQIAGSIFPGEPADVRITVDVGNPPPNDNFASPTQITSIPFNHAVNTADATTEFGEPSSNCFGGPALTVWYRYNATSDKLLIGDTTGSGYPAGIAVYTDSPFGLAEVACSVGQRVALEVEAGTTYYLQVSSLTETFSGQLQLSLDVGQSPPNDDFADARAVTSTPFEDTVDTFTATRELSEPLASCAFGEATKTVWYRIVPQQSGYITASIGGASGNFAPVMAAAYEGTALTTLTELACANPYFGFTDSASFQVTAGQTYYVQAGAFNFGGFFGAGTAGFVPPSDLITIRIETLEAPTCAPSEFTLSDRTGDVVGFGGPTGNDVDVTSISGGSDGSNYCVRIQLNGSLPPAPEFAFEDGTILRFAFDTDSNQFTGFGGGLNFPCDGGLGRELLAIVDAPRDVVIPLQQSFPPPLPIAGFPVPEPINAFVLYGDRSVQLIIPMGVLEDDEFRFAVSVGYQGRVDCVPNGGAIVSPTPAQLGDANCDGAVDSLDSSLILQRFADLLPRNLPCEYAGDVNQNGSAGPIDAVLILQYSAGMIDHFTPAS